VLQTPQGLGDDEWPAAVLWTHQLHCNSMLAFEARLDRSESHISPSDGAVH
jgi:hypothetical protein